MQDSIQEINLIKKVTDSIIQELWEASRDNDPTASFALPIEKPWTDPVEKVKKGNLRFTLKDKSITLKSADAPITPKLVSTRKIKNNIQKTHTGFRDRLKSLEENHQALKLKSKDETYMENLVKDDEYYKELQNFRKMYWNDLVIDDLLVLYVIIFKKLDLERMNNRR